MNFTPLKNFMDRLTAWRIPGNSVSVRLGNKEVFRYTSGYANLEAKEPMREDLLFNIYSCSKVATVTAALQLYERGFFLLDDPLYDFIPEYREMYTESPEGNISKAKNPITMRHLFTMTSGLTYNMNTDNIRKKAWELTEGRMDTLTVVKCMAKDPLSFEPGSAWQYSLSHDVLGAVVEVISGKKFRDYMKYNIFEPLGMKDTSYHNEGVRDRMCEQYRFVDSPEEDTVKLQIQGNSNSEGVVVNAGKDNTYAYGTEYDSGGAGITTSIEDYSLFASALANGGVGANGERILSKGTVELLRTNQLSPEQQKCFNWEHLRGYGYGLGVRTMTDRAQSGFNGNVSEFGWGGAAGATLLADPDTGLSVFYAHHMLNPQETYYQPRLRNVVYTCINS